MRAFETAAVALHRCGYSPLPIMHGAKRPGVYRGFITEDGDGPWFGLKDWQDSCRERASVHKAASWGRMADAMGGGLGVACGYGGLIAIDIDDDALVAPILAVLPEVMVGKVGAKGITVFLRGDHPCDDEQWWAKRNYKAADGRGLIDFLAVGSQTLVPPTQHPDIGRPYEWTTVRTLLTTPIAELPAFTDAHRAAIEEVLRAYGWNAPEPAQPRREVVARSVQSAAAAGYAGDRRLRFWRCVVDTMSRWVPKLGLQDLQRVDGGWRSVASFRESGSDKSKRDRNLSIRDDGRISDHAGKNYNATSLVAVCLFNEDNSAAYAWLCEESGFNDAPATVPDEPVAPTYADNRVSLDEAMASVRSVFSDKFTDAILEARAARNRAKIKQPLIFHVSPVEIIPPETGVGKTYTAREAVAPLTKAGMKFVFAVPDHGLAKEIAGDFAAMGVNVEVYRGFEQPDPRAPKKHKMCRRPEAFKAVRALGIATHSTICESPNGAARCHLAKQCALIKQRGKRPDIWIVPHALLFTKRPDFFFEPDAVVIDETFFKGAIISPFEIDVEALRSASIDDDCKYTPDEQDALMTYRHRLRDAVKENGDEALSRAALIAHGIDAETAGWLSLLERRPLDTVDLSPGMNEREIKTTAKGFKTKATMARNASAMWDMITGFLYDRMAASGRLNVEGGKLSVSPFREVHQTWLEAPVVYMDATPLPVNLVEHVLGRFSTQGLPSTVTKHPDIRARWSDHVRVRQILVGPSTMSSVGVGSWARKTDRNQDGAVEDIVNYIRFHAALTRPGRIGVITFKELRERIEGKLPDDIIWMHYGAVAGRNEMKTVTGLIVIGRPSAQRRSVETDAATLTGRPIAAGDHQFKYDSGGIRMADGSVVATSMERHDDPDVEALRWLITEGNLIQAIGRLRPHRRTEPCWLHILTDVPLPIIVHEHVRWGDVKPDAAGVMALQGVVLTNVSDARTAFGVSERDARGVVRFSKGYISLEKRTSPHSLRAFRYMKAGPGQKEYTGYYLPAILTGGEAALQTWLESKLGPLASRTAERLRGEGQPGSTSHICQGRQDHVAPIAASSRCIAARNSGMD